MTRTHTATKKSKKSKKRQVSTIPAQPHPELEGKLLALGGSKVLWQGSDPHADLVAAKGHLFSQPVQLRPGEPNRCHVNTAKLWEGAKGAYQLVTGYALSGDQWVSHSWVVDDKNLYETTHRFDRYFGVVLPVFLALHFWFSNVYKYYFPDREAPSSFWDEHPGIVYLARQMGQRPQQELFRQMEAELEGGNACEVPHKDKKRPNAEG